MMKQSGIRTKIALSGIALTVAGSYSQALLGMTVGAYAVANHSSCGAGNIPGTIAELNKFFASPDLPADFEKNFYWTDQQVKQTDWTKDGDYQSSTSTGTGFDGSDASLLTYIASHGVTSGGVYKALSGSRNNGGCYIPTSSLELGNNVSRYTILSTCQGLKIGTGDNPAASGENPTRTWKNAAKGLNCILGYSNNMADADEYGEYLLKNIKEPGNTLAKAFMDASEAVSENNIPAVLCFGSTEQDAASYIAGNSSFDTQSRPNDASSWVYRMVKQNAGEKSPSSSIPAALKLRPVAVRANKIAELFLGKAVNVSSADKLTTYSSDSGAATYNKTTGVLSITNNLVADALDQDVPSSAEAEEIARHALKVSGLGKIAGKLSLSATAEDVLGGLQGIKKVTARKFIFKQDLAGSFGLSQQGSVEVTIGAAGTVTSIKSALVSIDSSFRSARRPTEFAARMDDIESAVIEQVAAKAPGFNYRVIKQRIGYDAGNFHKANQIAPAVIEMTVEASQGEFARNFIEKVTL